MVSMCLWLAAVCLSSVADAASRRSLGTIKSSKLAGATPYGLLENPGLNRDSCVSSAWVGDSIVRDHAPVIG